MPSNKKLLQAAAGSAGGTEGYVEDVFSTFLYNGTGSAHTITNGIDLAGEGGLVWIKSRTNLQGHFLSDTNRGVVGYLGTENTSASAGASNVLTSYNSNGFSIGTNAGVGAFGQEYTSWTFRKAKKFFDVVTWSGDDVQGREISHNLDSVPGMMIVKQTNGAYNWQIYHVSNGNTKFMEFTTGTPGTSIAVWNNTTPTDSVFTVGSEYGVNQSGKTYVAYLFASDAGGYGDDGDESIIKCGSFNSTTLNNLGWEPQWLMMKNTSSTSGWFMMDNMRGMTASTNTTTYMGASKFLYANATQVETDSTGLLAPAATGFGSGQSGTYIYIAIRRPMKTPEAGTEVFLPSFGNASTDIDVGFPLDLLLLGTTDSTGSSNTTVAVDRLRGNKQYLQTTTTSSEFTAGGEFTLDEQNNFTQNQMGGTKINWFFKRATGFMDVVAYAGNATAGATQAHNLGVVPEMMIVKRRNASDLWPVYHATLGNTKYLQLNGDVPEGAWSGNWNNTTPTASVFSLGNGSYTNASSSTYVAYLFASVAGVSKVGSYTGTGSSLDVPCGFTTSARFILIRRYNYPSGGSDWYLWDSVRGISAGNDPYLLLNTTGAEVTGTDYVAPLNAGFTVTSNASSTVNVNGGTYIFLAIA